MLFHFSSTARGGSLAVLFGFFFFFSYLFTSMCTNDMLTLLFLDFPVFHSFPLRQDPQLTA